MMCRPSASMTVASALKLGKSLIQASTVAVGVAILSVAVNLILLPAVRFAPLSFLPGTNVTLVTSEVMRLPLLSVTESSNVKHATRSDAAHGSIGASTSGSASIGGGTKLSAVALESTPPSRDGKPIGGSVAGSSDSQARNIAIARRK